jgi:hypothetical protein
MLVFPTKNSYIQCSLLEIPGQLMAITVHHAGVFLVVPIKAKAPLLIGHYIHHDACWYFNQKLPPKGVYIFTKLQYGHTPHHVM